MYLRAFVAGILLVGSIAVHAEDLVIGQVASLTNRFAKPNSGAANKGFNLFFSGVNSKGGVYGRKVVLNVFDDDYDPAQTPTQVRKAIADPKVLALFGTLGTAPMGAIVKSKALPENDIAMVGPFTGVPEQLGAPNIFPIRASYFDQLREIGRHSRTLFRKKVAFLHLDTPLAPEMKRVLEASLAEDGRKLTGSLGVVPSSDPEKMKETVRAAVAKILVDEPDTVVVFAPSALGPALIKEIRERRSQSVMIYGIAVPSHDEIVKAIGIENATGLIIAQAVPLPNDSRLRVVKEYLNDLKKYAPDEKPSWLMLEGYLGARVMYEALKKAGPNPSRTGLIAALDKLGKVDIGDFEVNYTPGKKSGSMLVGMTMINKNGFLVH